MADDDCDDIDADDLTQTVPKRGYHNQKKKALMGDKERRGQAKVLTEPGLSTLVFSNEASKIN